MEHVPYVCPVPHEGHCHYCTGGLFTCTVCGATEGGLTTECCGVRLPQSFIEGFVYEDGWDFYQGKWHPPQHCDECGDLMHYTKEGYQCYSTHCNHIRKLTFS